jgi:hypothetical protein
MAKRIVSVGFHVPGTDVDSVQFKSNDSVLDADIVIFSRATLEGSARLFQPIILGLIAGFFITVFLVSIYRGLSYLLD